MQSQGVEAQAEVGEPLVEEPPAEVVERLADYRRVPQVDVALLHLLELLRKKLVHQSRHLGCAVRFTVFIVTLYLVQPSLQIYHELRQKFLATSAGVGLHVDEKLPKDKVDGGSVGLALVQLLLLAVLLPVVLDAFQVELIVLAEVPYLLVQKVLVLDGRREKFIEILFEFGQVVALLSPVKRLAVILVLDVRALLLVGVGGDFGVLGFAVVFGLDVGVQGGVAEVGLAAVAGEVPAILVVPRPPLALEVFVVQVSLLRKHV